MCGAATDAYLRCLEEEWGVTWDAVDYEDEDDFREACLTWAWEMRLMEKDAGLKGEVDEACETYAQILEPATCDTYLQIDWNTPPF